MIENDWILHYTGLTQIDSPSQFIKRHSSYKFIQKLSPFFSFSSSFCPVTPGHPCHPSDPPVTPVVVVVVVVVVVLLLRVIVVDDVYADVVVIIRSGLQMILQMIILRDRALANDHLEGLVSCK